jgi:hypothetical protein
LSEERVERDPVLYEPLNEDVGFFVNPNLGIKSHVSHVLLHLLALLLLFTFLLNLAFVRSLLLGQISSCVDLACGLSSCSLVGRLLYFTFYSLALL